MGLVKECRCCVGGDETILRQYKQAPEVDLYQTWLAYGNVILCVEYASLFPKIKHIIGFVHDVPINKTQCISSEKNELY